MEQSIIELAGVLVRSFVDNLILDWTLIFWLIQDLFYSLV